MSVLLAREQALTLHELLAQANTAHLDYDIAAGSGVPDPLIRGIGSLAGAGASEISFLADARLAHQLENCAAAAIVMTAAARDSMRGRQPPYCVVLCSQPYLMYALLAQWFDRMRLKRIASGVHPTALVDDGALLEDDVGIGPYCVVETGARIGGGSRVGAGCTIGTGSVVGRQCLLYSHVTLYHNVRLGARVIVHSGAVLGADGFGFAPDPRSADAAWVKIGQLGGVTVGDDVEIGANTTIDRGAIDDTVIGDGVKLDNQIMIGHNVRVGEHSAMAACVGVAGSTTIGRRCTLGGAAMISGHLVIGDDVHVSGGTAITTNIDKPGRYTGVYPAAEHSQWQRNAAVASQLAQLRRRLRQLEKQGRTD
ncbi:MAG: UDP-3-O-(3-hydroxymyristoyl)glucosamine N-acyltransferase [Candidimonas sp.]|nr:MAG: UDP-3-O-(3-hydroxymyristoyl)glucosamine N-acyltransferase [Candidimonas sp.]